MVRVKKKLTLLVINVLNLRGGQITQIIVHFFCFSQFAKSRTCVEAGMSENMDQFD